MTNRQVEILAPAGSMESLRAAISAGADAVYMGGSRFGARAYADNPEEEQLLKAIDYVHLHGRKLYMTVNTLLKNEEMEELYDYLLPYYERGLDAVIVQDTGVFEFVRENFPGLPIHVSTQMTVTHALSAGFFKEQGAERIVPARELNLSEIRRMKEQTDVEIECFVHGALCYCYSGQCLMSSMIGGRSGNRGQCAQPCRLPYEAGGRKAQDIMSLKDLCTIEMLPELIEAGIDSFKIEGRMKQPDYVYTVVRLYRKYADLYLQHGKDSYQVSREDLQLLQSVYRRRGYNEGYYHQHNGKDMISFKRPSVEAEDGGVSENDYKIKEKINGELILSAGSNAKIYLECNGQYVEYIGEPVQKAMKQPLSEERVRKQMEKTGETEFEFAGLNIRIEGEIFLPMQALNELRRESLRLLEEKLLEPYRRKAEKTGQTGKCHSLQNSGLSGCTRQDVTMQLGASVSTPEQLRVVLGMPGVSIVYVDGNMGAEDSVRQMLQRHREGIGAKTVYVSLPYIFREQAAQVLEKEYEELERLYDGALIRNWESYCWLEKKGYSKPIVSDYNLYVFNQRSRKFVLSQKIDRYTAPVELNSRELSELDIRDASFIGYGFQPVMVSANCIQKNTAGCTKKDGILYLTDRYKKKFAVKNYCKYCYNITYNPSPLMLLHQKEEVLRLNPAELRLDFVTESAQEVRKMTELYTKAFLEGQDVQIPDMEYTKGHFKRGVK